MKNPCLRIERRFLIDRQRTTARYFLDEIHTEVESLQLRREIKAQRRLSNSMRPDERQLESASIGTIGRKKLAHVGHSSEPKILRAGRLRSGLDSRELARSHQPVQNALTALDTAVEL